MSETMTPTPRTDAIVRPFLGKDESIEELNALLDHARTLERELASAPVSQKVREALEEIESAIKNCEHDFHLCEQCGHQEDDFWQSTDMKALLERPRLKAAEALTLLAPDTRTEYDKAVEALAPYLPKWAKWVVYAHNEIYGYSQKPFAGKTSWEIDLNGDDSFLVLEGIMCPSPEDWRTSLRQIKSGKVVPHV